MMEHIYPAFERGRIMKKELLWALRDYSYSALQLQYADYPNGILSGCGIRVEDYYLCVEPGIIKCQEFVFLITGEERVEYSPTERCISLKFRLIEKEVLPDYTRYVTEFILDENLERQLNEVEICRFKLKTGARLRTEYKDFYDIETEYDTINLAHATWAAAGENTLSKEVTDYFARKVLECENAEDKDIYFSYFLLQSKEAIRFEIITDYIIQKTSEKGNTISVNTETAFHKLEEILESIRRGRDIYGEGKERSGRRMVILD